MQENRNLPNDAKTDTFFGSRINRASVLRISRRLTVSVGNLFFKNPILVGGIILSPVISAVTTFRSGVAISIAVIIICIPSIIISELSSKYAPFWVSAIIGALVSALMSVPAYKMISPLSPDIFDNIGIYFPIIMLSSFSSAFTHNRKRRIFIWSVTDVVCAVCGFAFFAILIGSIREILAYGTFNGKLLGIEFKMSGVAMPFFGFILVGFILAIVQKIKNSTVFFKNLIKRRKEVQ
ncbi:MAG: hypothetical protein J5874_02995 [Oscillospiraceae bacterium]|nr:hypothetical protein [Oscillospiraceae bacterium]